MKARYFFYDSFQVAGIGSNPSFVWRSLLEARNLICAGSILKVGTGESINIWRDPWIPDLNNLRVTTDIITQMEHDTVQSLIFSDVKRWNTELIQNVFNHRDASRILQIPLSYSETEDTWLWIEGEKGKYTVKSGYRLLSKLSFQHQNVLQGMNWLKLWSLFIPPKIKNFVWRVLQNCIPTLENLRSRHVDVQLGCPVCRANTETLDHVLFSCPFAQRCWDIACLNLNYSQGVSVEQKFMQCFQNFSLKDLEVFCAISWNLWAHRNKVVWQKIFNDPVSTVNGASVILFQWQHAQTNPAPTECLNQREGVIAWQRPISGWVTCNVDAAVFSNDFCSSFGCLLRDENGDFIAGCAGKFWGIVEPKIAEAMAFREALAWLKKLEVSHVFIELDSLAIVQAFQKSSDHDDASFLGSIIKDCYSLVKDLRSYSVYFIRRSANSVAHKITRVTNSRTDREEWFSMPSFLIDVISSDNQ